MLQETKALLNHREMSPVVIVKAEKTQDANTADNAETAGSRNSSQPPTQPPGFSRIHRRNSISLPACLDSMEPPEYEPQVRFSALVLFCGNRFEAGTESIKQYIGLIHQRSHRSLIKRIQSMTYLRMFFTLNAYLT